MAQRAMSVAKFAAKYDGAEPNFCRRAQVRQYFHRYTDDAVDLCDVLGSYVPGGKVKLDEVSKIFGASRET